MSAAAAIVAQLRAARLHWHEIEPGIRMQLDTPSVLAARRLVGAMDAGSDEAITLTAGLIRAWEGVTGELIQGQGVGSAEVLPVSVDLAALVLADRPAWLTALAVAAVNQAGDALKRAESARGNSVTSSTGS